MVRRFVAIGLIGHLLVPAPAVASLTDGSTLGISRGAMGLADPANGIALPPDVASDGSFTFRFPIELPPGTGGMQPAVALAYRSSAHADSVAGYGWSLDLGTISRSLKRGVPTYDDGLDDFTLDGQDLVFGADGFYHTRRESFLRIQRVGESWEVRSKDGSVARYGTSENSRLRSPNAGNAIFSWQLAEREDSNGNAYSIVYDDTAGSDPGLRHPLRIEYTKHRQAGGSFAFVGPARTAVFVYENRPDVSLRYSAGLEQRLRKRLARVDVSIGSTVIRGYRLIYQQSTDSTRSLLAEIRDEGYPGTGSAARVTKLTYRSNQVSQGWQEATSWTFPPSVSFVTSTFRDGGTRIADVDGDGYPDLFRAVASSSNATTNDGFSGLYRNATGTGFAQRMPFSLPVDQVSGQEMSFVRRANQGGDLPWGTEMLDLDGDGKADVVRAFGLHSLLVGQLAARFQTFRNGPAGWQLIQNQNSNEVATSVAGFVGLGLNSLSVGRLFATSVVAAHGGTSAFADLNGDGLPELVKRVAVRQSGVYAHVERGVARNERGIFAAPVGGRYGICDSTTAECISKSILSSWVVTSGFSIESSQHQGQRLVDLNADGLDDSFGAFRCRNQTVCADDSGLLRYSTFLNDGFDYVEGDSGWLPSLVFEEVDASGVSRDQGVRSFDVNGDGRVDLVQATPTTRNLWLNTGNPGGAWMELGSNSPWNIPAGLEFVDAQGRDRGVRLADLNGDGMVDVIRLQEGADPQVFLNRGVPPDLLASITNPLGGRTEVTYDASNPIPGLKGGLQVVSSILVDSRNQTLAETRFVYEGGLFDTTRREFRGFETITASFHDLSLGATVPLIRTTTTRYHQDEARAGLVRDVVVRDAAGLPWSGTEMTYTEDATPPFASLPRTVTNLEYDGQTSPRRSCTRFEYDDIPSADGNALTYGNLTRRIEFGEVAGGCESLPIPANARVLALGYTTPNTALHLVDRPAWIQLRSGTAGAIVSRSQFYYDNEQGAPYHGNLTRRVDERGLPGEINPETTWVYDGYGNVKEIRDPRLRAGQRSGAATSITYDPVFSTFPIEVVNPLGHRLVLEYGPSSLCSGVAGAVQYPAGAGLVHVERGPNDLAQSPVEGRLRCFDGFGRPLVDRAPGNLAEATWVYVDAPPVSVTRRDRSNPAGPDKRDTRTVVDGLGRPTAVFESAPGLAGTQTARIAVREVRYDAVGRIVNVIDPYYAFDTRPPPTVLSYDPLDRLAEIARPGVGRITRIEQLRGVRSITDPNANTVRQTIDAFGDIVEVEDEAGRTFYKYDAAGRLGSVRDPRNNDTEIAYDRLGQRTTLIDPDAGLRVFGYDANGNVIREVTELGETTWSYDPLDRPLRRDTGSNWTTWSWDTAARGRGRLGLVSSNTAIHSIGEYDLLGRALQERTVSEPYLAPRTFDFQNQYDPLGQLRTRTYPNGRTLEWVRDPRGFLKEIRSGSIVYADLLDWDARGRLSTWRSGRQAITTQGFDPETGLLESIVVAHPTAGPLLQRAYGHDPGDRIVDVTDGGSAAGTRRYEYDPLGRLTLAERPASGGLPAVRLHYGYDALGNLLCKDAPTPPSSGSCTGLALTYPSGGGLRSRPHLPLTVGGLPAARDDAGNLIGVGSRSFSYNALGQLMEMRESSALRASFEYGPQGALFGISETMGTGSQGRRWRIAEDFDWNTSAVANIHVALGGGIVATHAEPFTPPGGSGGGCAGVGPVLLGSTAGPGGAAAAAGELLALFAPGLLALLLAQLAGSRRRRRAMLVLLARARRPATALATAGSFVAVVVVPVGHEPFSGRAQALASAGLVFYHADHLGSAVVVHTDTLSFQHAAYEPFGQSAGTAAVPEFGFTGQRFVARTGLYHYGARWYDPAMGRFLQPDPLVPEPFDPQSLNRYSYVLNDPVNRVDPTGLQPVSSTEIIPLPDGLTITKTLTLEIGGGAPIPPFNPNLLGDTVGRMVLNATLFSFTPAFEHGLGGRTAADFSAGCGGNAGCLSVAASMQQTVRNRANFFSAVTFAILMVAPLGAEIGATRTGIAGSGATRGPGGALPGQIGRTGEDFLHRAFGGRPASFETSQGRRFVDSFAGGVARESKVGRVSMSPRLRSQISKDLDLLQTRQIDAAEFHFFRSPVTGRGGPTPSVERLLKDCGIGCVIHE